MAAGVTIPGALNLESNGVSHLSDVVLSLPTDPAFAIPPAVLAAAEPTLADPRPDAFSKVGVAAPANDLTFLDRIHVIPRRRDLGPVISEQEIEVEVWNAYRNRGKILDEITVEGPAGIEVVDHLGLPAELAATQSEIFVVEVSEEGDPQINNVVTWVFLDVVETGTTLEIVGFRLIPFPFAPNMARPISESFGYLTDVLEAFSSMEQRVQLRVVPIGSIGYSVFLNERRDAQMAAAILFGNQARAYGVARWSFRVGLTAPVAVEDELIYCPTTDIPFVSGGLIMLWISPYQWEVLTIDSVETDHLVVTSGARKAWTVAATTVVPMVVGRLSNSEALTWEALYRASQDLTFDVDGFTP